MNDPHAYQNEREWEGKSYYQIITAAVADFAQYGFDSLARLEAWMRRIKESAQRGMISERELTGQLTKSLEAEYTKLVDRGGIERKHKGVSRFTVDKLKPQLRAELDRRIMASTALIRLNRDRAVDHTLQRFGGWASSVPPNGVPAEARTKVKQDVAKSLKQLPFEERRVIIDQGHKLNSAINNIVAVAGGAIACVWHSHAGEINYKFRPEHKARNDKVYAIKDNWAIQKGLMNNGDGIYEDMDAVGQLPFCRCYLTYIYHIRDLPEEMITQKGKDTLEEIRKRLGTND